MPIGSAAIKIINAAYVKHNLNPITTFDATLDFPYNIAVDIINDVVGELNRLAGNLYFTEMATPIVYTPGNAIFSANALGNNGVNPRRIKYIRRENLQAAGELVELEYRTFLRRFGSTITTTAMPSAWSKYSGNIILNTVPDQDYNITVYHYTDIPLIVNTTDTLCVPLSDEDVLRENCYAVLGCRIGKWDWGTAERMLAAKTQSLLLHDRPDAGLPKQLPASF